MIRLLLWLVIGVPIGVALISLAVTTTADATVRVWPLAYTLTAPLGLMLTAVIVVAFFIGIGVGWLLTGKLRRRLRAQRRQIEDLRDEIATTHARLGQALSAKENEARKGLPAPESKAA